LPISTADFDDDEEDGLTRGTTLDLGDSKWQPKGIDSFICESRIQRGRIEKHGKQDPPCNSPPRASRAANLRRAAALFCKLDSRAAAVAALDSTPNSVASESEDEAAPVAMIPVSAM